MARLVLYDKTARIVRCLGLSALLVAPASSALNAATATTTFSVTATVLQVCAVSASTLAFGNYDPTSATPTDGTTTVSVTCTNGTAYTIGLNAGTGSGATVASRKMTASSNLLNYTLYQDNLRATVWGNTVSTDTVAGTGSGAAIPHTVYGRIPAQQTAPTGSYSDTVTVTVTY